MLQTKDLILKPAEYKDWKSIYQNLWCHEKSAQYMLWKPVSSEAEAQIKIKKTIAFQAKHPLVFFVYEQQSGQAIGFAGMTQIADGIYEDTGIAIGPAFTGKGYGKQILQALVKQAFEELGADKFVTSCRSQNIASQQLQLSCGFTYTHSEDRIDPDTNEEYVLEFYELSKS